MSKHRYPTATHPNISRSRSRLTKRQRKVLSDQAKWEREIQDVSEQLALVANDPNMTIVTGGAHAGVAKWLERLGKSARGRKRLKQMQEKIDEKA